MSAEGRTLGEFVVREQIGEGGFGVVHRAEQPRLGREAVVKLLRGQSGPDDGHQKRFLREAMMASRLDHPFAAHVYGGGVEPDGLIWIAMELVRGKPLDALLREKGRMPFATFLPLFKHICEVVQTAHEQGIVHRDLKPANVLVIERAGHLFPKLLDFGVAKAQGDLLAAGFTPEPLHLPARAARPDDETPALDDGTMSMFVTAQGATVGSPAYMAPEQWRDSSNVDRRCDLYALGVLAYEALVGRRPFAGATREALGEAHATAPIPPVGADLPAALDGFFKKALAKNAADRFSSALEVSAALQAAGSPPAEGMAAAVSGPASIRRTQGRRRLLLAALGATATLAAGVEIWRRTLPAGERRVALEVKSLGGPELAWAEPIARDLLAKSLAWDRRFTQSEDAANVVASAGLRREGSDFVLESSIGRAGGHRAALPPVRAPSLAAAVRQLGDALAARLGKGQAERGPSPEELKQVAEKGAASFAGLQEYQRLEARSFPSDEPLKQDLRKLIARDPAWAHPSALLAFHLTGTADARQILAEAQARMDRRRDPLGAAMVDGFAAMEAGGLARVVELLDPVYKADSREAAAGLFLAAANSRLGQFDRRDAILRDLYRNFPDAGFGTDLAGLLRGHQQIVEADEIAQRWVEQAPSNEAAHALRAAYDLDHQRTDDAEARMRRTLLAFGDSGGRARWLIDVLIFAGKLPEARALAGKEILRSGDLDRAGGHYRTATINILEGKFSAAYEALEAGLPLQRKLGMRVGNLHEVLAALRELAPLVATKADAERLDEEVARAEEQAGRPAFAALIRFESSLRSASPSHCPDLEQLLAAVPGPQRETFRRYALRASAQVGCAACSEVVRAGRSPHESTVRSVYQLAKCAEKEGQLDLAQDALKLIVRPSDTDLLTDSVLPSALHFVLARLVRARVLARLGDQAGARAQYQSFVDSWGHADHPLPELAEARAELARLR